MTDISENELNNLKLIMNIPLELSVEIGSAKKKIADIMSFSKGTVVELDTPADAPVNVIVNGQPVAKGIIVSVDDHFAVKVTEVIKNNLMDSIRENN